MRRGARPMAWSPSPPAPVARKPRRQTLPWRPAARMDDSAPAWSLPRPAPGRSLHRDTGAHPQEREGYGASAQHAAQGKDHAMITEPVLRLEEVGVADVPRVGGKNASLGEM